MALRTRFQALAAALLSLPLVHPAAADTTVGGTITSSTTWTAAGSPYLVTTDVTVSGTGSPVLTIAEGAVVKVSSGKRITIGGVNPGGLVVSGTVTNPVRITSDQTTPTAGYWAGVFLSGNLLAGTSLQYVTVEAAGSTTEGGVIVSAGAPAFDHVTLQTNKQSGLKVSGGTATVTAATITGNSLGDGVGIDLYSGGTLSISGSSITSNSGAAVALRDNCQINDGSSMTITGNTPNVVRYRATVVTKSQTFRNMGVPYLLDGGLVVAGATAPTLTLDAGVVVQHQGGVSSIDIGYQGQGRLLANGTASQPVRFTTNQATVTAGYWRGLFLIASAAAPSSLSYVTIEGGGLDAFSLQGGIGILGMNGAVLDHVTIQTCLGRGIHMTSGTATISNSTITGVTGGPGVGIDVFAGTADISSTTITGWPDAPIAFRNGSYLSKVSGLTLSGNGKNVVRYRSTTMTTSQTFLNPGVPYLLEGGLNVAGSPAPTWTVAPGVVVQSPGGTSAIDIAYQNPGRIVAIGTAAEPITFTTNQATPTAGYYRGFAIAGSTAPASQFDYVIVEGGGLSAFGLQAGISVFGGSPTFDHMTVRTNLGRGLNVTGGAPVVTNSTFTGVTGGVGIGVELTGGSITLRDSTISGWPDAPLAFANAVLTEVTNLTMTGNGKQQIRYRSGSVGTTQTWWNLGLPYVLDTNLNIASASSPILTIEPGVTIKMQPGTTAFDVAIGNPGRLVAVGTAAQPIKITTTEATPSVGAWRGMTFSASSAAASTLAYFTLEAAGKDAFGYQASFLVFGGSPTFDHVTLQSCTGRGLHIVTGNPVVTASTLAGVAGGAGVGIDLYGGSISITGSTISGWSDVPLSFRDGTTISDYSGNTTTGNGRQIMRYRSTAVSQNQQWKNWGMPYFLEGSLTIGATAGATLTIDPGVTVQHPGGYSIGVGTSAPGRLVALGTSALPIRFTTNQTTVTAGYWRGLTFTATTALPSQLSWVTVEGAGASNVADQAGIVIYSGNPTFDNLVVQTTSRRALQIWSGAPVFTSSTFTGISGTTPNAVDVRTGAPVFTNCSFISIPGTAVLVSAGADATITGSTFSGNTAAVVNQNPPQVKIKAQLNYWGTTDGPSGNAQGTGQSVSAGVLYDPWLTAAQSTTNAVSSVTHVARKFDPAAALLSWQLGAQQSSTWTLTLKNLASQTVRTMTASGSSATFSWDGKNDSGQTLPDDKYTYQIDASGGSAATPAAGLAFVDSTLRVAIDSPTSASLLSNVYQSSSSDVPVNGTARCLNLATWNLSAARASTTTAISNGTASVNGLISTWATGSLANDVYTLSLYVTDTQYNDFLTQVPVTIGNFSVTQQAIQQVNGAQSGTVALTTIIPFTMNQSLVWKSSTGAVERTMFSGSRAAGTYVDTWNVRNDAGQLVPDGPHFWVSTGTVGASTATIDLTNQYYNDLNGAEPLLQNPTWDPWAGKSWKQNFTLGVPMRVSVAYAYHKAMHITIDCDNPPEAKGCLAKAIYMESGPQTWEWNGLDMNGNYIGDKVNTVAMVCGRERFSKNAVVVYGTKPTVANLALSPIEGGAGITQTVSADFTTYQSQNASVAITLRNMESNSILRTISLANQVPGHVTAAWDGLADNGALVAPGRYKAELTVTDSLGNVLPRHTLTVIR